MGSPGFERDGYVLVRGLLDPSEVAFFKQRIQKLTALRDDDFGRRPGRYLRDVITKNEALWPIIFHERLLAHVRGIVGPTARYLQNGDLLAHFGTWNWHRDVPAKMFSDPRRPVVRAAIYLHDFAATGSRLGVIAGSHRPPHRSLADRELRFWNGLSERLYARTLTRGLVPAGLLRQPMWTARKTMIRTSPGDCVIFDAKLLHSGTAITGPTYKMLLSYGPDDEASRAHVEHFRTRTDYLAELPEALRSRLAAHELLFA
ncbi:MAG: phytanoyl-CoA dioxygenase family protein [Deltaproteobacteria bacterium]|nr:phytanoyl-CoA dioxygenase family protein [Deltaproteobacteria bacterium]